MKTTEMKGENMFRFRSPRKRKILLVLLAICLSAWAVALVEATNARYVTRKAGSVSVRVASFLVETGEPVLQSADGIIDCNADGDRVIFSFPVRNRSEVAVNYAVSAEGVPDSILLEIGNEAGTLAANGSEAEVTLAFSSRDPLDRRQITSIGGAVITVTALQKGAGDE